MFAMKCGDILVSRNHGVYISRVEKVAVLLIPPRQRRLVQKVDRNGTWVHVQMEMIETAIPWTHVTLWACLFLALSFQGCLPVSVSLYLPQMPIFLHYSR